MNKSNSIDHLKNKETWSIEEVLELLCGPSNPSTVIRGETHKPMGKLLETAANQGRFGMLVTGSDKFYWDMELLQGGRYPDEPLDEITEFNAHYLKFLDWIKDEDILDKIQLDDKKREEILKLIETFNEKRPEVKPAAHVIDYQKLIEEDFWALTDLRIVLFGETYSSRYAPDLYHKYNSNLETLMQRIDRVVQDAALAKRYLEVHKIQNRSPLIDSAREDKIEQYIEEFGYLGVYDADEDWRRSQRYYHTPDLFNVLTLKGFPIPQGLTTSLDQNQIEPALELLKELRKNILHLAVHGENPPNTQVDKVDQEPRIGLKDEIEQDLFEKEGDFWIVSIRGEKASGLKHSKGMSFISYLFTNKGKEFHVIELDHAVCKIPHQSQFSNKCSEIHKKKEGKYISTNVYAEEMKNSGDQDNFEMSKIENHIDPKAIPKLLQMEEALKEELEGAMKTGDTENEERLQGEIEALKKALNLVSFGGKGKTDKPQIENVRTGIFNHIKRAINNIKDKNPTLGEYLSEHIKTGEYCTFTG
ncbi:MAG TPA: hypothetical protein EYQ84_06230 [Nitrospinaceae bacterium]|jgi:hypothetical protein|nr:hypothetical protein [Nitrospinaceae bacterium]